MNLIISGILSDNRSDILTQPFYLPKDGWVCVRPKTKKLCDGLIKSINDANTNNNITCLGNGSSALSMVKAYGSISNIKKECNVDYNSLIRVCCCDNGFDPGDISAETLKKSGKFFNAIDVVSDTILYNGDILISETDNTIAIIVSGNERDEDTLASTVSTSCYPRYKGNSKSIIDALNEVGVIDPSMTLRKKIAIANGITNYKGTAKQNALMVSLLKDGKLIKG